MLNQVPFPGANIYAIRISDPAASQSTPPSSLDNVELTAKVWATSVGVNDNRYADFNLWTPTSTSSPENMSFKIIFGAVAAQY